jgi:cyclopropane-fatty-acyl-phospholipid synthase
MNPTSNATSSAHGGNEVKAERRSIRNSVGKRFLSTCEGITQGSLRIITPEGDRHTFGNPGGPEAELQIHDWGAVSALAARGDIGLGEAYINGLWDSPSIEELTKVAFANEDALSSHLNGSPLNRALFLLTDRIMRRNSKSGSKRNIQAHYDVGNDFYKLWLDPTLTYSSALYDQGHTTLEDAQTRKYQRLLDRTQDTGERVLEIGCGWGGFAEAAADDGRNVTGLTISPAQHAFASQRLSGKPADIQLCDYRDVNGTFDSIVSIEMIEAVGERYWPNYFGQIKQRLADHGRAAIQAIIVEDDHFPDYRKRSDFIRHYTFPGGMLLSPGKIAEEAGRAKLAAENMYRFGQDYARTLREWVVRFEEAGPKIRQLGYSDGFMRSWRFYLEICAGSFAVGRTDVVHVELRHA